jgi:hypothetical protein
LPVLYSTRYSTDSYSTCCTSTYTESTYGTVQYIVQYRIPVHDKSVVQYRIHGKNIEQYRLHGESTVQYLFTVPVPIPGLVRY